MKSEISKIKIYYTYPKQQKKHPARHPNLHFLQQVARLYLTSVQIFSEQFGHLMFLDLETKARAAVVASISCAPTSDVTSLD